MPNIFGWGNDEPQILPKEQGGDTIAVFTTKIKNLFQNLFNTLNSYPWSNATQISAGYMSAEDKKKVDSLAGIMPYVNTINYVKGDVCVYNGNVYVCILANGPGSSVKAPTNATYWSKILSSIGGKTTGEILQPVKSFTMSAGTDVTVSLSQNYNYICGNTIISTSRYTISDISTTGYYVVGTADLSALTAIKTSGICYIYTPKDVSGATGMCGVQGQVINPGVFRVRAYCTAGEMMSIEPLVVVHGDN